MAQGGAQCFRALSKAEEGRTPAMVRARRIQRPLQGDGAYKNHNDLRDWERWNAEQLHDLILFLSNTGLRPDEAKNLEHRDVAMVKDATTRELILEIAVRGRPAGRARAGRRPSSRTSDYSIGRVGRPRAANPDHKKPSPSRRRSRLRSRTNPSPPTRSFQAITSSCSTRFWGRWVSSSTGTASRIPSTACATSISASG